MCMIEPRPLSAYSLMPYMYGLIGWRLALASTASVGADWANELSAQSGIAVKRQMRNCIISSFYGYGYAGLAGHAADHDRDRHRAAGRHRLRDQCIHLHQTRGRVWRFTTVVQRGGLPADGGRTLQVHARQRRHRYPAIHARRRRQSFAGAVDEHILPSWRGVAWAVAAVIHVQYRPLALPRRIVSEDGGFAGRHRHLKWRGCVALIHDHYVDGCLPGHLIRNDRAHLPGERIDHGRGIAIEEHLDASNGVAQRAVGINLESRQRGWAQSLSEDRHNLSRRDSGGVV